MSAPPGPPKPSFKIRLKLNPQIQAAIKADASLPAPPAPPPPPPPPSSAAAAPPSRSFASFPPPPPRISVIKIPTPSHPISTPIRLVKSTLTSRAPSPAVVATPPPPPPVASGSGTTSTSTPYEPPTPTVGTPVGEATDGSSSMPGTPMSGITERASTAAGKKVKPPKKPRIGADGKPMVSGRLQLPLKEVCEKMIREVRKRDDYAFFIDPVTDDDVPGYSDVIKEPMSLTRMEEKLANREYKTFDLFEHDLLLIFINCKTFNPPDTMFVQMANKLQNWVIKHLPTNRALVRPAPPSPTPAPSPSPSVLSTPRSPSAEVQSPAKFTPEGVRIVGTGSNQLGKKRGPYKKSQNAVMTAAPVVVQEVMGSTDDAGKLRGTSLVEFEEGFCHLVKWWETRGRRLKTKKEVAKLSTHPDYVHTLTDSSFNLAELESLYPTLNAFVLRPESAPGLIPLPRDFLAAPIPSASTLLNQKAFAAAAAPNSRPPPPAPPSSSVTPLNPTYGNLSNENQLAPAFSWRKPRPAPPLPPPSNSNAPPPPPRTFIPVYNPDPFAYYAIDSNPTTEGIIVPQVDPYRAATTTDFGSFPLLHSHAAAPQAHDQASQIPFLRFPFPEVPTFFDPLLESQSPLLSNRMAAARAARAEATLREAMYGSHVGEAYAASLERFMREAIGEEGGKSELTREWIEEDVVKRVYGAGGFAIGRAVGEAWERERRVMMDGEEVEEEDEDEEEGEEDREEQKPMIGVEEAAAVPVLGGGRGGEADVTMSAKLEPGTEDATIPPPLPPSLSVTVNSPNPKLLNRLATRTIRSLPSRHQQTAHLAAIRAVPISLPLLLHRPEEFTAPIPPAPPSSSSLSAKRKRSLSTSTAPEVEAAYGSPEWVNGVLKTVGKELGELTREQEEKNGSLGGAGVGARSTRAAKAKEVGGPVGEVGEDERMKRIRLMLLSLAKFLPTNELEKINEQQLELFPSGPIRARYASSLLVKE